MGDTLTLPPDRRPLPWPQSTLPGYVGAPPPPPTPPPPTPIAQPPTVSGANQPWTAATPGQPPPSYGTTPPQPPPARPGPFVGTTSTQPTPGDYRPSVPGQVTAPWMPNSPGASFFGQPGNRSGPVWTWSASPDDPSVIGKPLPDETPDETRRLNEHMQHESGGRNVMNQWAMNNPQGYFNEGHTDSGYWQDVNDTWQKAARLAGIDLNQYPTARSADYWTQRKANLALLRAAGDSPWSGGRGSQPGGTAGGGRDNLVPQRYLPSQQIPSLANREPGMWGREPQGGYGGIGPLPRTIPDFINIMTRMAQMAPMLSGRSAFGQAYAANSFANFVKGYQQGQEFQTQLHAEQYKQAMTEFKDRLALENEEIGSIVAAEESDPEAMNRDLMEVANRNNDRVLAAAIANGPDAVKRLMQARDHLGSDASKAEIALQRLDLDRQRTQAYVEAQRARTARGGGEGTQVFNVTKDGKPTGQQVRMGRDGGTFDLSGNRITLGPGEGVAPIGKGAGDVAPGWLAPGTQPAETSDPGTGPQPGQSDEQVPPAIQPPPAGDTGTGTEGGGDQGDTGGGDQGAATQAPPAPDQAAQAEPAVKPYQEASLTPTPPPTGDQGQKDAAAIEAGRAQAPATYQPGPAMKALGPTGQQEVRNRLRGGAESKDVPPGARPAIQAGLNELQGQIDDVGRRASLPQGDPSKLRPDQIMPALRSIDPGFADDVGLVLNYNRAVPSAGGFGAGSAPFWNRIANFAQAIKPTTWRAQNYQNIRDFGAPNGKSQQTFLLASTLASTGASVMQDLARIKALHPDPVGPDGKPALGPDGQPISGSETWYRNALESWQKTGGGTPEFTTLMSDWQSYIVEANRLRTATGSVQESLAQIEVLTPEQRGNLIMRGIIPSSTYQFRDNVKHETANSWAKVTGEQANWRSFDVPDQMPGQAYVNQAQPTIDAIMHMNTRTGDYYGVTGLPPELGGTGRVIPRDTDLDALYQHAMQNPNDPQSVMDLQRLRALGVY